MPWDGPIGWATHSQRSEWRGRGRVGVAVATAKELREWAREWSGHDCCLGLMQSLMSFTYGITYKIALRTRKIAD